MISSLISDFASNWMAPYDVISMLMRASRKAVEMYRFSKLVLSFKLHLQAGILSLYLVWACDFAWFALFMTDKSKLPNYLLLK